MRLSERVGVIATMLLLSIVILIGTPSAARAQALVNDPGCTAHELPRNDDEYTDLVPIGFDVFFGNQFHSSLRISNNGYVSFSPMTPLWWLLRVWEAYDIPLIAVFHADIDTRGAGTTPVTYGPIVWEGHPALCVNWVNVGYFDSHDELLNRVQLVLVGRGDQGAGDFDIYMNYGQVHWDDPPGDGSVPPRAGIYNGTSVVYEFPGSNAVATLVDGGPHALASATRQSAYAGRNLFEMRGGQPPNTAVVAGTIIDTNGAFVVNAPIEVCPVCLGLDACALGTTDSEGRYSLRGLDPDAVQECPVWRVKMSPPANSQLLPAQLDVTFTSSDQIVAGADITARYPDYVPSGSSITPSTGGGFGSVPRVYWQSPLVLKTTGCPSILGADPPRARYMISQAGAADTARCDLPSDPDVIRCGEMPETPPPQHSGVYTATIDALAPAHGQVTVTMSLQCPQEDGSLGPPNASSFDLYIDPSGWVQTVEGRPLAGALVTLYRAESPLGPFEPVPDGSALMAPKNRTNPDRTDAAGHFAWDTVAGYYVVRAEVPGCVSPIDPLQPFVETDVLPVPPEWLDLRLVLDCGGIVPPQLALPTQVLVTASSITGGEVSYEASAVDDRDGPVPISCAPASGSVFAIGTTTVACTAEDAAGNVAHAEFPVRVTYAWSNVLAPLRPNGPNKLQRNHTVPVAFRLTDASHNIKNLTAHLYVAAVVNGVPGPELPAKPAHGNGSAFHYESCGKRYEFAWSTKHLSKGHYQLRIDLGDGVSRLVPVELR